MVTTCRWPVLASSSAFLSAETWTCMVFSSTTTPGHTRFINSSLLTTSPFAAASTHRISIARLPSATGFPLRDSARPPRSSRNWPRLTVRSINRTVVIQNNSGLNQGHYAPPVLRSSVTTDSCIPWRVRAMNRRRFLELAGAAAAASALSPTAGAQTYPMRPVHLIVGFPPGGGTDAAARLMGQWLSQRLGQQFVVENRPGAGTNTATEAVAKAAPDGYTLLLVGSPQVINAALYDKLNFNFVRDIAPTASIARGTYVIVVNPSFSAKTVPELIAYAKANPGKINLASAGV